MPTKNEIIVPQEKRESLARGARYASDYAWEIAQTSIEVLERFLTKQEAGEEPFIYYNRGDVWRALSYYCCKSVGRVRRIAEVGAVFQPAMRWSIEARFGLWEFGYYEAIYQLPASKWDNIFKFLKDYLAGEIEYPGRRLGVTEFIFLYEKHIEGQHKETIVPEPEAGGVDLSTTDEIIEKTATPSIPFQDLLYTSRLLEQKLRPYQSMKNVHQVIFHLQQLRRLVPEAMRECGIAVPIDKEQEIS